MPTAIGSFPHATATEAVDAIMSVFDEAPLWPQLPRVDFREGMMIQYLEGLPGVKIDSAKQRATLDIEEAATGMDDVAAAFDRGNTSLAAITTEYSRGFEAFLDRLKSCSRAPAVIKGQVTGPVTQALALETSFEDRAAIFEPELARMIARFIGLKARFQEERFAEVFPDVLTLLSFDEPSMGSIGSAVLNLDPELAQELLTISMSACKGLSCLHCCGETDVALVTRTGVNVINFDAYDYVDCVAAAGREVAGFMEQGGMLAIGVVPSSLPHPEAVADETVDSLFERLKSIVATLQDAGMDEQIIAKQSFLTPSCGTGGMTVPLAHKSLSYTVKLAQRARHHWNVA